MRCGGHDPNMVIVVYITEFIQCVSTMFYMQMPYMHQLIKIVFNFNLPTNPVRYPPHFADGEIEAQKS